MSMMVRLTDFVRENLLVDPVALAPDDDLLTTELVDSMGVMLLVDFINEDLKVEVRPEDVTFENFQSIRAIHDYVESRRA